MWARAHRLPSPLLLAVSASLAFLFLLSASLYMRDSDFHPPAPPPVPCGAPILTGAEFLGSGWTKLVYRAQYQHRPAAVKTVNVLGTQVRRCLDGGSSLIVCYRHAAAKILKEMLLLRQLAHRNVLKVLGYCAPVWGFDPEDASSGVLLITELGESFDMIRLLQLSWEERLRIALGLSHLLDHLAHSPLGPIGLLDFRRQQFVLIDGELTLSDIDDAEIGDPTCTTDRDCEAHYAATNVTLKLPCNRGTCQGYSEAQNVYSAGRHFASVLLPYGVPPSLRPHVDTVLDLYNKPSDARVKQITEATVTLADQFISGRYLQRSTAHRKYITGYRELSSCDLPGQFDYRCQRSLSGNGCTLSVFDAEEAAHICYEDLDCQAFVLTSDTTWTGRRIAHFKTNYSLPCPYKQTTLYLRMIT